MESSQALLDLIERERPWLAIQPRFEGDWERGCRWAIDEMQSWVLASGQGLIPSPIEGDILDRCRLRVWTAWSYHWHEAAWANADQRMDGTAVANMLKRGKRPGRVDAQLGGDPIRDAVLVEACLLKQPLAYGLLREVYRDVFLHEARRVGVKSEVSSLEEEVWDRLDPIDQSSRRWLERYSGYSSLKTFLRVTVRHRLLDILRSRCTRQLAERTFSARRQIQNEGSPITRIELSEFRAQVKRALLSLPEVEQRLLILRYLEALPNGVVAREIGLSDGQTSRLHAQAVKKLRDLLKPLWQEEIDSDELGYSVFAQFLLRGLSETLNLQDYTQGSATPAAGPKGEVMNLIQLIEKQKKQESTPRKASSSRKVSSRKAPSKKPSSVKLPIRKVSSVKASVRKASVRGTEPLALPPIDLEGLIPDTIAVAALGTDKPEVVFEMLRIMPIEERPGTLCVDARSASAEEARTWLDKFDAIVFEQDEKPVSKSVEMHVVMFLSGKQDLTCFEDLLTRPDVDWVVTEDRDSPLTELYPEVVRNDLTKLLSTDPTEGLDTEDDPNARPIEEFIPQDELKEWEQRLKQLGYKGG